MESKPKDRAWAFVTILLLVVVMVGAYALYRKSFPREQALVIRQPEAAAAAAGSMRVYVGGAVKSPGVYPAGGSLQELITSAGGVTADGDLTRITLTVGAARGGDMQSQKININTAPAWLLEALPQVGPATAREIIDYRTKNGPFRSTQELIKVKGVGPKKFEQIKELISID